MSTLLYAPVDRPMSGRRRSLALILYSVVFAGPFFAAVMGGVVPLLATAAGLNVRLYGLLSALPAIAVLAQVPAMLLLPHMTRRVRVVLWVGLVSRLMWIPVAAVPLLLPPADARTASLFLVMAAAAWAAFQFCGFTWQSLMSDLIPARRRGAYVGRRHRLFATSNLLASLGLAACLPRADSPQLAWIMFAVMTVTALSGAAELLAYGWCAEPERRGASAEAGGAAPRLWDMFAGPLRDGPFRAYLLFAALVAMSNGIVAPFLWMHLLDALKLPASAAVGILQTAPLAAAIVMAPVWGRWIDRHGSKAAFALAIGGGTAAWLAWPVVTGAHWWLGLAVSVAGSVFWIGVDMSFANRLFALGSARGPAHVAVFNIVVAAATSAATYAGGEFAARAHGAAWVRSLAVLHARVGLVFNEYLALLGLCIAMRLGAMLWLLRRVPRDGPRPTAESVRLIVTAMQTGLVNVAAAPFRLAPFLRRHGDGD